MQTSCRLSTATHMMILIYMLGETHRLTSESIAKSVQVNPVVVRRLLGGLKEAGLVAVTAGKGGARALRSADQVTLWDIYTAVEAPGEERIFGFHDCGKGRCPVAQNMHRVLDRHLENAQSAFQKSLESVTLEQLRTDMADCCGVSERDLAARLDV